MESQSGTKNKAEPHQAEGKTQQYTTNDLSPTIQEIELQSSHLKREDHAKHINDKPTTDWWKILFDALLVTFTGILAWSTIKLWQSTEKLWKAAQDQSEDMKYSIAQAQRTACYEPWECTTRDFWER